MNDYVAADNALFADGDDYTVAEKIQTRADLVFPEAADRRAAEVHGPEGMAWIRRAWRMGLVDIVWLVSQPGAPSGDWAFAYTTEQACLLHWLPEPPDPGDGILTPPPPSDPPHPKGPPNDED